MKKLKFLTSLLFVMIITASCQNYKKIPYLQTKAKGDTHQATSSPVVYDAVIMPNDLLNITVNASDKEAGIPFNLVYPTAGTGGGVGAASLQKYLVDNEGYINFPTVGMVQVEGLTRRQAEKLILDKISSNFKEMPIVIVSFSDYKISVIGEVARPGTFNIENEKVNILQALSFAGDLTIFGKRDNLKVIREKANGEKEMFTINLNDPNLIYSPQYYLQQNDVIYVQPNKVKAQNSEIGPALTLGLSSVGILISVTNLIINLTKK